MHQALFFFFFLNVDSLTLNTVVCYHYSGLFWQELRMLYIKNVIVLKAEEIGQCKPQANIDLLNTMSTFQLYFPNGYEVCVLRVH